MTSPPRAQYFDFGIGAQRRTGRSRSSQRENVLRSKFPFRVTNPPCSLITQLGLGQLNGQLLCGPEVETATGKNARLCIRASKAVCQRFGVLETIEAKGTCSLRRRGSDSPLSPSGFTPLWALVFFFPLLSPLLVSNVGKFDAGTLTRHVKLGCRSNEIIEPVRIKPESYVW